ncbi:Vitamin B12 import system permease protein BtuC [Streptomyces microflavus]
MTAHTLTRSAGSGRTTWALRRGRASLRVERRSVIVCGVLVLVVAALGVLTLATGSIQLTPAQVLSALFDPDAEPRTRLVVVTWRLPRLLFAVVCGAALAVSGALFQSLTKNPLGSPDVIGFASGSYAGASVVMLVLGTANYLAVATGSLIGGAATALLVYLLAYRGGVRPFRLIIVGIAVGAFLSSITSMLLLAVSPHQAMLVATWGAGSLSGLGFEQLRVTALVFAALLICSVGVVRPLVHLEMGDDTALALGVNAQRARLTATVVPHPARQPGPPGRRGGPRRDRGGHAQRRTRTDRGRPGRGRGARPPALRRPAPTTAAGKGVAHRRGPRRPGRTGHRRRPGDGTAHRRGAAGPAVHHPPHHREPDPALRLRPGGRARRDRAGRPRKPRPERTPPVTSAQTDTPVATLPVADARRTRAEILRRLRAHRRRLGAALLTLLGGTAATLATPPVLGGIVDAVADGAGRGRVPALGIALVAATAVGAVLAYAGGRMLVALVQEVLAGLREDVFETAVHLPVNTLESSGSSDVVSRVTRDVEAVSEAASDVLPEVTNASFTIGLSLVGLAVLDLRLALAGLLCLPVHVYATRQFLRRSHRVYGDIRRLESARGQSVIEAVRGAESIRAYRTQDHHLDDLAERSVRAIERQRDGVGLRNRFTGLLNAAEFLGLAAVLVTGFALFGSGAVTLGAATAAALYFHRLFGPVGALLGSLDDIQRATVGLSRLVGITDLDRHHVRYEEPAQGSGRPNEAQGAGRRPDIDVKGVSYAYATAGRPASCAEVCGLATSPRRGADASARSSAALHAALGREVHPGPARRGHRRPPDRGSDPSAAPRPPTPRPPRCSGSTWTGAAAGVARPAAGDTRVRTPEAGAAAGADGAATPSRPTRRLTRGVGSSLRQGAGSAGARHRRTEPRRGARRSSRARVAPVLGSPYGAACRNGLLVPHGGVHGAEPSSCAGPDHRARSTATCADLGWPTVVPGALRARAPAEPAGRRLGMARVLDDGDWETTYRWTRINGLTGTSKATVTWAIGADTAPGTYRIVHHGDAKNLLGKITPFTGASPTFTVSG